MTKLKAYAKINLGLRIIGKREDGYHNIETIYHRINLCDEIILEPSLSITIMCDNISVPSNENNLCFRAAKLLQQYCNIDSGVYIKLIKNIPVGAGLGGGSSDAAATLLGLVKIWNLGINKNKLHELALQLGSDVPYFLKEGTAYATGRGEILDYFKFDIPYWIVLVYPNINISTSWAYQSFYDSRFKRHESNLKPQTSKSSLKQILLSNIQRPQELNHLLHNDFEPIILHTHESIAYIKVSLYAAGAKFAQMSGSGSAVYGLFGSQQEVNSVLDKFGRHYQIFITAPNFQAEKQII